MEQYIKGFKGLTPVKMCGLSPLASFYPEECPKKPMASEVRSAIDLLTSYSLFVNEGVEEIRRHVQKIEALAERNFRSSQRQQTLLSVFGSKMQSPLNNKDQ